MAGTLYFDNDADLRVKKLASTLVPSWFVAASPESNVAVDAALSGVMVYNSTSARFEAVIEGNHITNFLTAETLYYVVVNYGQNLRVVVQDVIVKAVRPS